MAIRQVGVNPSVAQHSTTMRYSQAAFWHRTITTAPSVPTATWTAVAFNNLITSIASDTQQFTQSAANLTVPFAGILRVHASVLFPAGATGQRIMRLLKNTVNVLESTRHPGNASWATAVKVDGIMAVAAGDVLAIEVYQSQGTALTPSTANETGYIMLELQRT